MTEISGLLPAGQTEQATRHIVMFSGGAGSWATAQRVVERHGPEHVTLLFADTLIEDEDLYRFLGEASADVGAPLVRVAEGRDPWQVFHDRKYLGNTRIDPCSAILKREFLRKWLEENCEVASTVVYVGIDWTEVHRVKSLKSRYAPWKAEAPLCEKPYINPRDLLRQSGITPPRLYGLGFTHNNCGGFCIKAGQGDFAILLRELPERYAAHEQKEQDLREYLGKDVAILRDRSGGTVRPLTLREFRERIEAGDVGQLDLTEQLGCARCAA